MTYETMERSMAIWAIVMVSMIVIGLPAAIIWGMHASHAERNAVEKPVPYYHLAEYAPEFDEFETTEYRHHHYGDWAMLWYAGNGQDQSSRLMLDGTCYYDSSLHYYQHSQLIELLGAEDINYLIIDRYDNGNLILRGATNICKHGEYRHVANCCYQ